MELEPIAVVLKFAFIAVLYLTLLWIVRSGLRDLRRTAGPGLETAGPVGEGAAMPPPEAWLVVTRGPGFQGGERYDLFGGVTIGRSHEVDIQIDDEFASSLHTRIYSRGGSYWVEDMGSTNGTFLNMSPLGADTRLSRGDRIRIGETEFTYEA